jgi:hypothetical protein
MEAEVDLATGRETLKELPRENQIQGWMGNLPAVRGNQAAQWRPANLAHKLRVRRLVEELATRAATQPATMPGDAIGIKPLEGPPEPRLELIWSRNGGPGNDAGGTLLEVNGDFFTGMMSEMPRMPPVVWMDDTHLVTLYTNPERTGYELVLVDVATKQVTKIGNTPQVGTPQLVVTADDIGLTLNAGLARFEDGASIAKLYAVSRSDALAGTGKLEQRAMKWGDYTLAGQVTHSRGMGSAYRGGSVSGRLSCGAKELDGAGNVMVSPDGKRVIWVAGYNVGDRTSRLFYMDSQEKVVKQLKEASGFEMPVWTTVKELGAGQAMQAEATVPAK